MNEYDIKQAFTRIENELISSLMRNMERHKAEEIEYGFNWSAWQAEQLRALENYRVENRDKFGNDFLEINRSLEMLIKQARADGGMKEEIKILKNIQKSYKVNGNNKPVAPRKSKVDSNFFQSNNKKLDALIKATTHDLKTAETAMLRRANDHYRQIIFKAQVYANTGAATYEKAVDMAAKDFLRAGIDCIEYKNGARHTILDYASMAIRTANKRASLVGAGEKRNEWGIKTVIVNNRAAPCERCLPFVGVVFIDDVWSGGSRKDGDYPLLSTAISAGLFHPNCKDGTSTYYPGITPIPSKYTKDELKSVIEKAKQDSKEKYAKRQAKKYERIAKYSMDADDKRKNEKRASEWRTKISDLITGGVKAQKAQFVNGLDKIDNTDIQILLRRSFERVEVKRVYGVVSNYSQGIVNLSKDSKASGLAHELFHEIDDTYKLVENGLLKEEIYDDYRKLLKIAEMDGKTIEEMLYSKYTFAFRADVDKIVFKEEYRGVSDIFHGVSGGNIYLGYGHTRKGYWDRKNALQKETWSQYGRILYEGNPDVLKMVKDLFPQTTTSILRTLKGMIK